MWSLLMCALPPQSQNAEHGLSVKMGQMRLCKGQEECRSFLQSGAHPGSPDLFFRKHDLPFPFLLSSLLFHTNTRRNRGPSRLLLLLLENVFLLFSRKSPISDENKPMSQQRVRSLWG